MPEYISPSQITMFLRCPSQYYFRYCEGLILPPKSAMTKGKAIHKGQEINYKQKIKTKYDLPLSDVQDAASTEFETVATETEWKPDEDKGKVKDEVIALTGLYHKEVAPIVQPEYVEEEVYVEIPAVNIKIKGFIDLVQTGDILRDTKSSKRSPAEDEAQKSLQLRLYSLAFRMLTGRKETCSYLDYLVNTKEPKQISRKAVFTDDDISYFVGLIIQMKKAISLGVFVPNPNNFMCSKDHCGYFDLCLKKHRVRYF